MEAIDPFVFRLSIFVLAIFVGYFVVWSVTPALHTPLMSVTNAISSVIVVGALIAVSVETIGAASWTSKMLGFVALILASVNIFGGFLVTARMLAMYKKKEKVSVDAFTQLQFDAIGLLLGAVVIFGNGIFQLRNDNPTIKIVARMSLWTAAAGFMAGVILFFVSDETVAITAAIALGLGIVAIGMIRATLELKAAGKPTS